MHNPRGRGGNTCLLLTKLSNEFFLPNILLSAFTKSYVTKTYLRYSPIRWKTHGDWRINIGTASQVDWLSRHQKMEDGTKVLLCKHPLFCGWQDIKRPSNLFIFSRSCYIFVCHQELMNLDVSSTHPLSLKNLDSRLPYNAINVLAL